MRESVYLHEILRVAGEQSFKPRNAAFPLHDLRQHGSLRGFVRNSYIVLRRAAEARVVNLTPHDFRRTFATNLLDANIDLVTVRDLMGHSDINTTASYDRRGEQARRSAVHVLRVPFATE